MKFKRVFSIATATAAVVAMNLAFADAANATPTSASVTVDCFDNATVTIANDTTQKFVDDRPGLNWPDGNAFTIVVVIPGVADTWVPFGESRSVSLTAAPGETISWVTQWAGSSATYAGGSVIVPDNSEDCTVPTTIETTVPTTEPAPVETTAAPCPEVTAEDGSCVEEVFYTTTTRPVETSISTTTTTPAPAPELPVTGSETAWIAAFGALLVAIGSALVRKARLV